MSSSVTISLVSEVFRDTTLTTILYPVSVNKLCGARWAAFFLRGGGEEMKRPLYYILRSSIYCIESPVFVL